MLVTPIGEAGIKRWREGGAVLQATMVVMTEIHRYNNMLCIREQPHGIEKALM